MGLLMLLLLLLNLVLQMRRQEAYLRRWRRRRVEGRGGAHERMVGAVVLKERREDQTISVMAVDWHWQASSSHFIPQCTVLTRNGGTESNEANAPLH